ncbi:MAG TPA: YhgE/Pip domain-containing protein [Pseudonocardiaceae bacterium]|nr:YhgE/Pip domain-containing protein [Pseudonocardiaceae bacterium]
MKRALTLVGLEIRRFRTPLQRFGLIFITCVPLLYGALYLWSNWDPYGRLNTIPVAVVDQDQPVTVNNQRVDAGGLFAQNLRSDPIFDWHFVSRADADTGVQDGRYYFTINVPADFSAKLASGATGTPQRAAMSIVLNDANGYVVGKMAESVQSELQNKIDAAAVSAYFESVFGNLQQLHDGITNAANGAGSLRDGLAGASSGANTLAGGLTSLKTGADKLVTGSQQVATGVNSIANVVVPLANQVADAIPSVTQNAAQAAGTAADAATTAAQLSGAVSGNADSVQAEVTALGAAHPELQSDPAYQKLVSATSTAAGLANQVDTGAKQVATLTGTVAAGAQTLAADAPKLQSQVRGAAGQIQQLATGATQVATGMRTLDTGIGTASTGANSLAGGLTTAHNGAISLADGLAEARDQIPVLSTGQQKDNAATLAAPVDISLTNLHPADTYGRGLTPFFYAIALWVFGLSSFLLLRASPGRALMSRAGAIRATMAGWLPVALVGVVAMLLLFLVLQFGLGLDPQSLWATLGLLVLAVGTFTAISHLLRSLLGGAASAVMLILLIVQLTTCGGIYPVETLPLPFRFVHPALPMSYLVDGLRVGISGGDGAHLVRDVIVVAAFGLGALILDVLAVRRRRTNYTIATLKPDLELQPTRYRGGHDQHDRIGAGTGPRAEPVTGSPNRGRAGAGRRGAATGSAVRVRCLRGQHCPRRARPPRLPGRRADRAGCVRRRRRHRHPARHRSGPADPARGRRVDVARLRLRTGSA